MRKPWLLETRANSLKPALYFNLSRCPSIPAEPKRPGDLSKTGGEVIKASTVALWSRGALASLQMCTGGWNKNVPIGSYIGMLRERHYWKGLGGVVLEEVRHRGGL